MAGTIAIRPSPDIENYETSSLATERNVNNDE
jgi:hypothetical protein